MSHPQTVSFELRVEYFHHDRPTGLPVVVDTAFDSFEGMFNHYRKERKRRSYADRATSGSYHMVMTEYGKAELKRDNCPYRPAINQTEFQMGF